MKNTKLIYCSLIKLLMRFKISFLLYILHTDFINNCKQALNVSKKLKTKILLKT